MPGLNDRQAVFSRKERDQVVRKSEGGKELSVLFFKLLVKMELLSYEDRQIYLSAQSMIYVGLNNDNIIIYVFF